MTRRTALAAVFAIIANRTLKAQQPAGVNNLYFRTIQPQDLTIYLASPGSPDGFRDFHFVCGGETVTVTSAELFAALKEPQGLAAVDVGTSAGDAITLIDGKCSACLKDGQTSTVMAGVCSSTLIASVGPVFDASGKAIAAINPNTVTCEYTCSRGHRIIVRTR